jgi:hypothetical protein
VLNIWPGYGYNGFHAIMNMGNRATKSLTFVGDAVNFVYRFSNSLRDLVNRRQNWSTERIEDAARISGATDWIARRAVVE